MALTIKTTRTRNGWRYRLTKRESPPVTLRHQHARLKMSGLRWQVWAHYASGCNGRWGDKTLAVLLECTPNKLSEARTWLISEGLLVRSFRGIVVPHWLR